MKKTFPGTAAFLAGAVVLITSCGRSFTQYVNPLIGSGGHGHVFVGAGVPFGMVQAGPVQYNTGWDWCSGYHYSDSTIIGFAQMHLSGTGIGDLGDISLMPVAGDVETNRKGLVSRFSHDNETVRPGYYSVLLDGSGIRAEMTSTSRVAFHRYTFPDDDRRKCVVIDLEHGIGWDSPAEGHLQWDGGRVVKGYRISTGWARHQEIFFYAEFSVPILEAEFFEESRPSGGNSITARKAYAKVWLDVPRNGEVLVKVALSPISMEKAAENMEHELPWWNFRAVIRAADKAWNRELSKINYITDNPDDKVVFYTALYHTMIAPSLFCDAGLPDGFARYTTLSLWDTYRAAHPLATIIHPEKMGDYVRTMLDIYRQQGKLPVWHLVGNETDCMVGNPGIPVLADMVLKGYAKDPLQALEAMKESALREERGMDLYREYGYIPFDMDPGHETVAKTLEYALADWCVAQVARMAGDTLTENEYTRRSKAYEHLFHPLSGFMRARSASGEFREPFSPFRSSHREDDYTEGNAWQYTWLVPHDIPGLITLFGGPEPFVNKLDSLFLAEGDLGEEASPDITGLIGQYAHGNEPGHHIPYMYAFAGQPDKTAKRVRQILTTMYHNAPDGLCGNEDAGQMSAWYILSALGFYQVEPAGGRYVFGSPLMDKAVIRVRDGKTFTIVAHDNGPENHLIRNIRLNGRPYDKFYIDYRDIMAGGLLEFNMCSAL
ncbi:MAG TPA: GH92 family glycosyl hydrolase [Bacteroidales bacterium]|jgi:predicted alpha-1,2-mannosidase|nr:GH92 family glycosyl hydrolase [Bacteroidales bacterium]MBV6456616.1 hypothetical protein [Bacteroidales bacterium]HOD57248.1 GH92 family glycosyl hydrolase [Bacteroidales bacterium]HOF75845.1 GH92 family glycosyl hydrolase [Bacteroidales bacterium]HOG32728.1 GH92 family glycosyl hydrolase [Bacteroidales bacterium]